MKNGIADFQEQLVMGKNYVDNILATMTNALFVLGDDASIRTVNPAACKMLDYPEKDLLGMPIGKLFEEDETLIRRIQQNLIADSHSGIMQVDAEGNLSVESTLLKKDGERIPILLSGAVMRETDGKIQGMVLVAEDITERKLYEEAQRQGAYHSGIAEISANVQHNIGNAINSIYGYSIRIEQEVSELLQVAELLRKIADGVNPKTRTRLKSAVKSVELKPILGEVARTLDVIANERLTPIVEKLSSGTEHIIEIISIQQDMAKGDVQAVQFMLDKLIREVLSRQSDLSEKAHIQVVVDTDSGPRKVTLPKDPLQQALLGLVKNCREAILQRMETESFAGRICIKTEMLEDNRFSLSVADNGCGLASEELELAFQFGYTKKKDGSGIRLHSTANFVQSLGGAISLHSSGKNRGAEVRMSLPVQV